MLNVLLTAPKKKRVVLRSGLFGGLETRDSNIKNIIYYIDDN